MELRHLRYFVAVAEELHFARAAQRLHMAQPPLSRQIRQLEAELKVRLFHRADRKVQLTQAGTLFLAQARETLSQAERATVVAQRAARGELGLLNIATPSSMPFTGILPAMLRAYRQAFPNVQLVLQELGIARQLSSLVSGELDIGFIRLPATHFPAGIAAHAVLKERILVALHEGHPLAACAKIELASLADESFIMYPYDLGGGLYDITMTMCRKAGFAPRIAQEAKTVPMAVSLAAAGLGVALVPECVRQVHTPGAVYRELNDPAATTEIVIAYRKDDRSQMVRSFVRIGTPFRADRTR
jgi:DNA-binding transcriptional LysR family regulator